jgi:hypothetical protein
MAGLTASGLEIKTQSEIQTSIEESVTAAIPGIDLSQGPEHQIIGVLSEELAILWEGLQATYAAAYPDSANGLLLDQVAAITGTVRRQATRSRVTGTVTLAAFTTLPTGSIAAVLSDPDAQFRTTADAVNGTAFPDDVDVALEAIETGPVAAPAGTLTVIVTPVTGWTAITNATDAALGRDIADDVELRETRQIELAGAGQDHYAAIRAAVVGVAEVIEAAVFGNETLVTDGDGRPGKSFEAVVWDGDPSAADDDELAQAIYDSKPAGILSHGVGSSGTAVTETGADFTILFTRATKLRVYVDVEVVLAPNTAPGWETLVRDSVSARGAQYSVGETAYASQLICAIIDDVGVVTAVTSLTLGIAPAPTGSSVVADYNEIIRIDTGDVTASEA